VVAAPLCRYSPFQCFARCCCCARCCCFVLIRASMVLVGTHDRHSALPRCVLLCLLVCVSFFLPLLCFLFCFLFCLSFFVLSGGESPSHWEYNHRALCSVFCVLCCGSLLCLSLLSFDTRHCRCVFCSLHSASLWATVTGPLCCSLVVAAALGGLSAALPLCSDCQWRSPCRRTLLEVQCPCLNWGLLLVECHDHKKND